MKFKKVLLGLSLAFSVACFSQQVQKEVLFTIDDNPYYTDEFIRVYNKNLDLVKDDSQKDLDNYLDLFIGYKLKVNKANKLGLQNNKKYQMELKNYRNQLSKNYLTDTEVTKELVAEAYKRSLKEINASHILFMVDENASPADTLKVYNKVIEVRNKALAGEDFGKLAQQYSEDPSAKENKGELGYFSVFRMVYPFETAAYSTPEGQISKPVRTRFGYHLVKVNDVRDNRGEVTVANIMILKPKVDSPEEQAKAKQRIDDIYQKLKQGEDFAALAKQFSEDTHSAPKGGQLEKFSSGSLSSVEFEDQAFALKKPGDISQPFKTRFGWHIIKLVERHPVKGFEEVQAEFENRVSKDDRSRIIAASMTEKLKKKYSIVKDEKLYAKTVKALNDNIYQGTWKLPASADEYNKPLITIDGKKKITAWDFLEYANMQQKSRLAVKPVAKQADVLLERLTEEELNAYYNSNLEDEFPEFGAVMQEYRDGLLLFDLMETEIWEKAKTDTVGLQAYYQSHIDNYRWEKRVDADVYSSTDKKSIEKAEKYLKKGKDAAYIKEELNTNGKVNVMEKSGVFEQSSETLPDVKEWKKGVTDVLREKDYYYVVKVNEVLPQAPKTLEECKGKVVNDYQQYLENNWVDGLKKEFTIKVNKDVFANVKKQLNQ